MKCRCTFCVMQYGNAPKTDNLKLVFVGGRWYLACKRHQRFKGKNGGQNAKENNR